LERGSGNTNAGERAPFRRVRFRGRKSIRKGLKLPGSGNLVDAQIGRGRGGKKVEGEDGECLVHNIIPTREKKKGKEQPVGQTRNFREKEGGKNLRFKKGAPRDSAG